MFTIVTSFLRTAVEKRNWLYSKVYIPPLGAFLTAHSVSYLFAPSLPQTDGAAKGPCGMNADSRRLTFERRGLCMR